MVDDFVIFEVLVKVGLVGCEDVLVVQLLVG